MGISQSLIDFDITSPDYCLVINIFNSFFLYNLIIICWIPLFYSFIIVFRRGIWQFPFFDLHRWAHLSAIDIITPDVYLVIKMLNLSFNFHLSILHYLLLFLEEANRGIWQLTFFDSHRWAHLFSINFDIITPDVYLVIIIFNSFF
jgi:hypothetical protein